MIQDGEEAFRLTMRTKRREWWITKLRKNIERDRSVSAGLASDGWLVMRFWESDVDANVVATANRVERAVAKRNRLKK